MVLTISLIGQDSCEDPNAFSKTTVCGTEFDLCIDRYVMDQNSTMELQVFTNDMNMFDPCQSYISEMCSNGTLEKLPNCNYMYTPDYGFYGNDTFYYAMIINDICTDDVYCGDEDGKIWTVNSRYSGPNGLNVTVTSKKGNGTELVGEVTNLQKGDYFLIDGSHLSISQANWTYTFSYPEGTDGCEADECVYEQAIVHTSCSQQIMGQDFGLFRVVSGCIATPENKGECSDQSRSQTYTITTQWTDTTMVVITVFKPLAIELEDFKVSNQTGENVLEWNILSSVNESYIDIEKSSNGKEFYSIGQVSPVTERLYSFTDPEIQTSENSYYRLKIVSYDDTYSYSNIISIKNHWNNIIQVFPNPTGGDLYIHLKGDMEFTFQYEVIDFTGNLILRNESQKAKSTAIHLNRYEMKPGMYLLRIEFENGGVHLEKFIYGNE